MRIAFHRPDEPDEIVATAAWNERRPVIETEDAEVREALTRCFRAVPVVVDDASFRTLSARGVSVLEPGTIEWFRAAAFARAPEVGLAARVLPEVEGAAGWDPAASYGTFRGRMRMIEGDRSSN